MTVIETDERVRAWVDLVYAAARRQMRGGAARVEEVVQAVFLVMARKGAEGKLPAERFMAGWLIRVTAYAVKEARRREVRRGFHERRAGAMAAIVERREVDGAEVAEKLDAALLTLGQIDREVVVRRYLRGEGVREVGAALGMSENTAGRRIGRALEKLRQVLGAQGVVVPVEMVMGAMAREMSVKAPAAIMAKAAGSSAAAGEIASHLLRSMQMAKVWTGVAVGAAAAMLAVTMVAMGSTSRGAGGPQVPPVVAGVTVPVGPSGVPAARPEAAGLDQAWEALARQEPEATRGMLALMKRPEETVAFLSGRLEPLTISAEEVRKSLRDLGSAEEKVWKPAMERLQYFDPRLAIPLTTLMDEVKDEPARRRMVEVLSDRELMGVPEGERVELRKFSGGTQANFTAKLPGGGDVSWWAEEHLGKLGTAIYTPKRKWTQLQRGIVVLGVVGTPEALAIVKRMTTGHAEAGPTALAKETLAANAAAATKPAGETGMEQWWKEMLTTGPAAWRGSLEFAKRPAEATAFLKTRLMPLKISAEEVESLVEKLGSENDAEWKGAAAKMAYFDPRLAVEVKQLMAEAADPVQNSRLVEVLLDAPPGAAAGHTFKFMKFRKDNYGLMDVGQKSTMGVAWKVSQIDEILAKTQWRRATRAEVVLGEMGTEEAKGILRAMATGHAEAEPTRVAVEELAGKRE